MGTKNNPANRGETAKAKLFNGKEVKPVKYMGAYVDQGNYISAAYEGGDLVCDANGTPLPWDAI